MRNSTSNQSRFSRLNLFIAFLFLISFSASAQFYTKHYIAPAPWQYFSKANEIVISTNSLTEVTITLTKSDGTFEATLKATKGAPAVYRFKLNATTLPMNPLNTVLNGVGLIITSTGPTAVNLRNVASDDYIRGENADAYIKGNAALTSFGDAGLGIRFRVGYYRDGSLGNFGGLGDQRPIYSVMATVDNTTVKIDNTITATLNAGQSYLFKAPIGTLVETSNPAVMNTAAGIDTPDGCGDGAYNQIPPEAVLGTEYFLVRGTGNDTAEQTTVVATKDDTNLTINGYSTTGALVSTINVNLPQAGKFYTFKNGVPNNGNSVTSFTSSRVFADKRVAVYSGTAQSCEVDISTIAPVSECGGSNFIETAKFKNYQEGTLDYFGYILLRSATEIVTVNGNNIANISGIGARYQIGTTGWYLINFNSVQIGSPDVLSIASNAKLTVSIVQQAGGFSMAGFFSNFAAQPDEPTLTYISGGGCTNNTAELTTPPNFAPYQWYYNGTAISGANSSTYTATKTGNYSVSSTLACGAQTQSKPVTVTLCTDLGITKTVDNATPCIGSNVEFTVKVTNLGGNNVSGVSVNDLLPSGYTYVSSTSSIGIYDSSIGTWSIGDVDAQTSVTLKITATVKATGNYTNTASLPASIDINTANNSASAAVNPKLSNLVITNPVAVCSPLTVDLTASAITAGSSSNLTLSYWTNSTATTSYSTPTAAVAGTYYIKAVSSDGCVFVKPVVVTVNALPTTPTINVNSGQASCGTSGGVVLRSTSSANTLGGSGSSYLWSTGENTRSITITTDGVYSLKIINSSGCVSNSSASITVTLTPATPTASNQTFCSSENKKVGDLVATGSNIKWYSANSGGTALSTNQNLPTTAGTYNYYASQTSANNCESTRTAIVVTINNTSSAPIASAQTFCAADNKKISDLSPSGPTIKWYDTNSSSSALAGTTVLTSKTYYVSQTANSCGESARTAVVVTINNVPGAPTALSQTFCVNDEKTVNDLAVTLNAGSTKKWYNASTAGTAYSGTELLTTRTYYVSQTNACGESTRTPVVVTVNTTSAPTASAQTFCAIDSKTVNDLAVTLASGASKKWYNASVGGTAYVGNEVLFSGTYYVSQILNSCESTRTAVAVTVNNTAAPIASSQTFCVIDNKTVNDLAVTLISGATKKWYSASSGGTLYNGTETLASANYYVSQTLNNCESSRILVAVTVNPTPATPSISAGGSTTFCTGGNVVLTSSSGIGYLWSNGATTQSITASNSGNYSVQVSNASGCYSASSTPVTVTVNTIPSAPTVSVADNCNGTSTLSTTATGTLLWSTGETTSSITVSIPGNYSVTQTVNGCTSASGSGTAAPKTAPSAPTVSVADNCNGTSTLSTTATGTLLWSTGETTSSITVSIPGNYSVTQTVNGCTSASGSGTAAPKTAPSAPTVSVADNCNGTSTLSTTATGTLLWSTGETTSSITVSIPGNYSVTQTVNGCTSASGSGTAAPKTAPSAPTVSVADNCNGTSTLSTTATGTLLWSTGETTSSITVSIPGNYSVTQTVNGCTSASGSGTAAPKTAPSAPTVSVADNCNGTSTLSTTAIGTLLWSTGETTSSITVSIPGNYSVTQTVNGCTSASGSGTAAPKTAPSAPTVSVADNCNGTSTLSTTATGTLLWSTGETTSSITVSIPGNYSVTQTVNGCTSASGSGTAAPKTAPSAPTVSVADNCNGTSTLSTTATGTLLWSTGETTSSITVSIPGNYSVTQTVNGCTSASGSGTAAPKTAPSAPTVSVADNCNGTSTLSTTATGTLLWSTGETTSSITVSIPGNYSVTQTVNGCTSASGSGTAAPKTAPSAPTVSVADNCNGTSTLSTTATGTLLWSTGETTSSITVSIPGNYSVTQTVNGCTSASGSGTAAPKTAPSAPTVSVADNCNGTSTLSTTATGTLLWSTGETTSSITVSIPGNYSVTQTVNGCTSASGSGTAAPKTAPSAPTVSVADNCNGTSTLSTTATGTLLWSTGETTSSITVSIPGNYSVTQTVNGCTSASGSGTAAPKTAPSAPTVSVADNCNGTSTLSTTATGTLLWSTGETTSSITVSIPGNYSVTQTVNGCTSASGSGTAAPKTAPSAPTASSQTFCAVDAKIVNDLVAVGSNLKWYNASTGGSLYLGTETLTDGIYYVSQTTNDCESNRTAVTVTITSKPAKVITTATICSGDIYKWSVNSVDYTVSGTYPIVNNGCTADQELHLTVINVASPIVGLITQPTCLSSTASVELSGLPTGSWTINPGNITGNTAATTITGLIGGNVYNYTVTDSLGCQSVPSANVAVSNYICAEDDTPSIINGAAGGTISTVFVNDKINGASFLSTDVTVSTSPLPTGIVFNSNGTITVAPNTFAGTYSITYTICMSANASVCDSATVDIVVERPVIDAVTETTTAINSNNGGRTISLTANDTLNGTPVTVGTGAGQVTFTLVSTLPTGLTLNADKTITVAPGTASGSYEVEYAICDNDHALNCDTVKSYIQVTGDVLVANTDNPTAVTQSATAQTIITVVDNDTRNGQPLTASEVKITTTVADPSGYLTLDPTTGVATLGANAPAGAYSLTYSICDKANASNCSTATVTLTVNAPVVIPVIDAVTETTTAINSNNGGTTISLTANDTLNGTPVTVGTGAGKVTFTLVSTLPAGLTINADKTITVAPGTASGNYEVEYTICDNDHALNCDTVKSYVQVTGDVLVANADNPASVTQSATAQTIITVVDNDTRNGQPLTASEVKITTTVADPSGYLTLDPTTGVATLGANAPAGAYSLTYSICDKTNASNCSTATVTLTVNAPVVIPVIDAVTETTTAINSNNGGTTISLTANDTLNGTPVTVGTGAGKVTFTLVSTLPAGLTINADKTITVAPGTASGNYEVEYTICDNDHALNCDTVKSYIQVTGDVLVANTDNPTAVTQSTTAQTIITVVDNDTRNGQPLTASEVKITTTVADPSGYLTLDPTTGVATLGANAPAGAYSLTYSICDKTNASNCSTASVNLTVNAPVVIPVIDAVTETTTAINSNNGGTTISLTANDTLNGTPVTVGTGAGQVTFTLVSTLPTGLTLNADKTITVAPGTASGSYEVEYAICDNDHALNCDTVKSYIQVTGDVLVANTDNPTAVTQSATAQTIITVVDNDTRNGQPLTASEVKITTTVADPSGYLTLDPTTGVATLGANAPAGAYSLTYSICDKANASNCSTATVTLTVNAPVVIPVIDAVTETTTAINSNNGGTTISLTANDTLNGTPVTVGTGAGKVTFTLVSTLPAGLTINADKTITVAPGTASGNYEVEYTICDNDHALNCDTVKSYVQVTGDVLVANADNPASVTQSATAQTIITVVDNDTRNGQPLTASEVKITTTVADPSGYLTLDPTTGVATLGANAPAGAYSLTYSICDKTNASNCSTATVTLTVNAPVVIPVIDAVTETTTAINSNNGGTTISLTANDTLNGTPVTVGTGAGKVTFTLVSTLPAGLTINADKTITVAPGTASGNYEVEYTICDNDHALNCDTVKSYIQVTGDVLVANTDNPTAVTQSTTAQTIITVVDNDTRNGQPLTASEVKITTTVADPSGYLTLDPTTGVATLGANAPAGAYSLTYSICDKTNASNCSTASVNLTVNAPVVIPVIDAVTETTTAINSNNGGTTISLTANDTLNGTPVTVGTGAGKVTFTLVSTLPAGLTINADKTITVAPGTASGNYEVEYTICDNDHALNCDTVKSYIQVTGDVLVANADNPSSVTQSATAQTIITVVDNDTRNGQPLTASEVKITTTVADPSGYLTLDPTTGVATLGANAPAGAYSLTYSICDKTNASNCSTATVTLTVNDPVVIPVIDAVTETTTAINSNNGGTTISLTANDTLNGTPVTVGTGAGKVTFTLVSTLPAGLTINVDKTITVAPGTTSGNYEVEYAICDNDHTLNCDTVKSYIQVTGDVLVANADNPASVTQSATAQTIITVVDNDTRNGQPLTASEVKITTTVADPSGYLTLDPTTGVATLGANAPAGAYSLTYSICDKTNASNCSTATVTLTVNAPVVIPVIDAVTETTTAINSNNGGTTISLTANDTLNGTPVTVGTGAGKVTFTLVSTLPAGLTINADKTITVAPGTASGNYEVEYTICDNDHALNCDTVKSYIQVTGDVLVANTDNPTAVTQSTTAQTIITVVDNDTRNGQPLTASEVKITTTVADPSGYLTLDPTTGVATLGANAPAGAYSLTYSICDKTNASNCSTASVNLTVNAPVVIPVIDAVTETTTAINSNNGGTTISLTANDTLNGTPVTVGTGAGKVTFTLVSTLPAGLTINADKTITVASGTASGNYEVEYTICDNDHALNCDTVKSYIQVTGDVLVANADNPSSVTQSATAQTIITVVDNDTRNGQPLTASEVKITTTVADPSGYLTLDPTTGVATLGANAPAGAYSLTYSICDKTNASNCSTATVTLTVNDPVVIPVIDAVTETTTAINSNNGGTTISLTANDTLNGTPVTVGTGAGKVTFTLVSTLPAGLTINADKTITVAPGTTSGNYEVEYAICDNDHTLNCDTVKSYIQVTGDVLVANADNPASVTQSATAQTIITVVDNDTRNGQPLTASEVKITTTVADPSGYLTLDPTTGVATLGANAPAGAYSLTYSICDKTNASNCSTASVNLTVTAPVVIPVIDAVTETTTAINSNNGGTTISLTANDTLNGTPVTVGTGAGKVTFTLVSTLPAGLTINADKTITVAPGTASGNYEVEYTICDNDHALNCDTVKSYIQVTGDLLVLKDDLVGPIAGVNHPMTVVNVLGNDTKNGLPITSSDVNLSVTIADPAGYLTLNPDGTIILKENAPAGTYGLTYQVCELNTTNCKTADVKVTVVLPTMTVTTNSYCSNNVPYVSYNVTPDNFTTNNLLTVKWIDSDNNVVATQTNLPLSGSILWPGAIVDSNGIGVDWPGWLFANGQWTEGADGFEKTRTGVTMEFSLNPTVSTIVSYPPATPQCNARPTFEIKANNDAAGPIDAKKGISTALNIFSNDRLNGTAVNQTAVVLTTVIPNSNLILNADGSVDVKTGTPSGTYQLTYQICEASNSSNCSQAVVNVTVVNSEDPAPAPQIITKDDLQVNVDGINGQLEFINVLDNDLVNGLPIDPANVVISNTPKSPYFEFNADGTVNVKPNTPGGSYSLVYQVCEKANSSNCSSSTLNVFVEVPNIAIIKTAVFNDENGNGFANAGETITYKFKVTNTGNVPLTNVSVSDPLPGVVVSGQTINLGVGESNDNNFTAKYKITQSDIISGTVSNQATAFGKSARGVEVEDKSDDESNSGDRPTVLSLDGCKIKVLNAFSPNGDSKNARFYIQGIECYPDNTVEIYNRWGVLVFDIDHYNNEDRVFVGVSAGRATIKESDGLPVGTYFYILKYKDSDSNQHEQSGYLYLNK